MSNKNNKTVAVLGLGAMGLPMAMNLAENFPVRAYDINAERTALAKASNIAVFATAQECVDSADVILVAVRNQEQLENLLYGKDGITAKMRIGASIILTSTVGIAAVKEVDIRLQNSGFHLIDAPVSGGPVRAGKGDLLVVVGANDEAWNTGEEILNAMASTLVQVGRKAGDGQSMKTVNQLLCGVHIAAAGEALALASKLGIDPSKALDTLMAGAAASFMLGDRGQRMLQAYEDDGAEIKSRLDIFVKDMGIVNSAARQAGLATPVAAAAEGLFLLGVSNGLGADDDSAVIKVVAPEGGAR